MDKLKQGIAKLKNPTDYNMSANRNADYIEYVDTDFLDQFKEYDREQDYPYEKGYVDDLKKTHSAIRNRRTCNTWF